MTYEKGSYGYIDQYKKKKLIATIIFTIIIVGLLVATRFTTGMVRNGLLVVAILAVLPAAKMLVGFIVVMKYHSYEPTTIDELKEVCSPYPYEVFLFDAVVSSTEQMMYLPFVVIIDGTIYGLMQHFTKKVSIASTKQYLETIFSQTGLEPTIYLTDNISELKHKLSQVELQNDSDFDEEDADKLRHILLNYCV